MTQMREVTDNFTYDDTFFSLLFSETRTTATQLHVDIDSKTCLILHKKKCVHYVQIFREFFSTIKSEGLDEEKTLRLRRKCAVSIIVIGWKMRCRDCRE